MVIVFICCTLLLSTYVSYNWEFEHFDHFHPIPITPTPPSGKHKFNFFIWVCLFVEFVYNAILVPGQHNDLIFLYITKMITTISLVTICHHTKIHYYWLYFPSCHFLSLWLIYFITGSMYLFISLTFLTHLHIPLPSGKHLFVLCMYDSVSL